MRKLVRMLQKPCSSDVLPEILLERLPPSRRSSVTVSLLIRCSPHRDDTVPSVPRSDRAGAGHVSREFEEQAQRLTSIKKEPLNKHLAKHKGQLNEAMTKRNKELARGARSTP